MKATAVVVSWFFHMTTTAADPVLLPMPRWRRRLTSIAILFHLIAIPVGSHLAFHPGLASRVTDLLGQYVYGLRIRQYWALFSPEPRRFALRYSAEIKFQDGSTKLWRRPYPPKWDFFDRHLAYSFQKWDLVDAFLDYRSSLWDGLVHYLVVIHSDDPYNRPETIRFIRSQAAWPAPNPHGWVGGEAKDLAWEDRDLFTYVVRTGTFQ